MLVLARRRPYVDQLRADLVEGVRRERGRRARRQLDGGEDSSALAVTREGRWITLRIADATADPGKMTAELRAAGVGGEVRVRPVSPSLEGRWAAVETRPARPAKPGEAVSVTELVDEGPRGRDAADVRRLLRVDFEPDALRVPKDFEGRVLLTAGRAPRGNELYAESASAFARGEPLYCSGIDRLPRRAAERAIAQRGYAVHTVVEPLPPRRGGKPRPRGAADVVVGAQLASTRPMAPNVDRPKGRREMILYVAPSAGAPVVYRIPRQRCGRGR